MNKLEHTCSFLGVEALPRLDSLSDELPKSESAEYVNKCYIHNSKRIQRCGTTLHNFTDYAAFVSRIISSRYINSFLTPHIAQVALFHTHNDVKVLNLPTVD